jgi:hypothetical protein
MRHDRLDEGWTVADLRHDSASRFLDEPSHPLANQRRILGDDDAERCGLHSQIMRAPATAREAQHQGQAYAHRHGLPATEPTEAS